MFAPHGTIYIIIPKLAIDRNWLDSVDPKPLTEAECLSMQGTFAPSIVARRVDGIGSITDGHWTIEFRIPISSRQQRNSADDDQPHTDG